MTLHEAGYRVGVRELHDRLSEHLERVESGTDAIITRRGTAIARLSAVEPDNALEALADRGLLTLPAVRRQPRKPRVRPREPVSDLVADQRR